MKWKAMSAWLGGLALILAASNIAFAGAVEDARAALKKGDYAKAAELAGKVPESAKDRHKALCVLGDAELAQEHWELAEKDFREALDKKPTFVPAMTGIGRALTAQDKLAEGAEILTKAMKLDNQDIDNWHALCANLIARDKPDDFEGARIDLVATLMLDAKDPITNRMLVEVLLKQDKVDDADKAAEAYAKLARDAAMVWFVRGLVLEKRNKPDKALEAYEKAVKKDDRMRDAHANAALLLGSDPTNDKSAERQAQALAHAQRYVDLGGKSKAVVDLLEKLKASSTPSAK
jgi:tetratricopeptide (TPR) repeat protein